MVSIHSRQSFGIRHPQGTASFGAFFDWKHFWKLKWKRNMLFLSNGTDYLIPVGKHVVYFFTKKCQQLLGSSWYPPRLYIDGGENISITYVNIIAGQCRTNPWPAVPDWTLMPECQCRIEAADYRKKCRCRTNFFQHSGIPSFTYDRRCLLVFLITWLFSKMHLNGLPCRE
jgi:hypothetical protein